ncbi:(Fe-S)-binding protein [soil metagenome]
MPSDPQPPDEKLRGTQVLLMATCLCDAFFADVAKATVEVLEHAGCEVIFPEDQTCCGQPAFNGGDFAASRIVARHSMRTFGGELPVVVPSASCAAMHSHGNLLQFENEPDLEAARDLGRRTWELCDFLVNGLGIRDWGGLLTAKIALHDSCHSRGTCSGQAMRTLLAGIAGLEVVTFGEGDQCCGFGGTFSVAFPHISGAMGTVKLEQILAAAPEMIVSTDMSCLLHLGGLAERQGRSIPTVHIAQILRDSLAVRPAPTA